MADLDLAAVRDDFYRGFSLRQLAEKYGVPKSTLDRWAKKYRWEREPKKAPVKSATSKSKRAGRKTRKRKDEPAAKAGQEEKPVPRKPAVPMPPECIATADDYAYMRRVALQVIARAETFLSYEEGLLLPRDLRSVSGALLDAKSLLGIQTPREAAESELRMLQLKREATPENAQVTVRFDDMEGAEE